MLAQQGKAAKQRSKRARTDGAANINSEGRAASDGQSEQIQEERLKKMPSAEVANCKPKRAQHGGADMARIGGGFKRRRAEGSQSTAAARQEDKWHLSVAMPLPPLWDAIYAKFATPIRKIIPLIAESTEALQGTLKVADTVKILTGARAGDLGIVEELGPCGKYAVDGEWYERSHLAFEH